jgi:hypothetical protein
MRYIWRNVGISTHIPPNITHLIDKAFTMDALFAEEE